MPSKPKDIVDRDEEWKALEALWESARPELAFVVGRRRIGKSYLLARFTQRVGGLYYQTTRRTESEQIANLGRMLGEHFDDAALRRGVGFPRWEALFDYLADRSGRGAEAKPLLLVLDEFPYLADAAPALASILQEAWDHRWSDTRIKLVLSGSYVTAMEQLEAAGEPLYGRRTVRLAFSPFTYAEIGAFVPAYDARDRLKAYGLFGHLPGHLALLDPERPLAENAASLLLDPQSRLADDAQHMLDAFLGEASVHYSILESIATGENTWSGITGRVGRSGGSVARPLQWLEGMGLIKRVVPITAKKPARSKRAIYRIADPYVAFWHREVAPLLQAGSIGLVEPEVLFREVVEPRIDDHMGPVFEEVCRDFLRRTSRHNVEKLPFRPLRVGEWWDARSTAQVDVVAVDNHGQLLVGECKWGSVTFGHLTALEERAARVAQQLGNVTTTHLALFTGKEDVDRELQRKADEGEIFLYTAGAMMNS